jgi:threonine/homoserine/homoserine lactone efflux protein
MGVRTLLRRPEPIATDRAAISHRRAFGQGVVVNILNPKVALFFLSFLPQFIDADMGGSGRQALALGIVFVLIGCLTDSLYSLLSSSLRGVLVRGRGLPFVQRYVAGSVFIGLGLVAATASAGSHTSVTRSR